MEHAVWSVLKKSMYTEEGQKELEVMYNRFENIFTRMKKDEIKFLFDSINEELDETFAIIGKFKNT